MTATTLQRLLRYPHAAVFDTAPGAELAMRVRHADGAVWSVSEGVLTVRAGSASAHTYDLSTLTVAQLAAALVADGFEVLAVSPTLSGRSAMVLVEGSGDQGESNGDHLSGFTSLLWALFTGYAGEVKAAGYQVGQALRQMVMTQAEGEWLDVWGNLYGDERLQGESDADYAPRIPQEAFRLRVNALGIEKAILDITGWDVRIEEPWQSIFRLDESLLSGPHKFYDGETIGYHLIQPVSQASVDWDVVLPIIERNKPAGVIVLPPIHWHTTLVDAGSGYILYTAVDRARYTLERYEDRALLDYSAYAETSIPNYSSQFPLREIQRISFAKIGSQSWTQSNWGSESWVTQTYTIYSDHTRSYRVYYIDVRYSSNFWLGEKTWSSAKAPWTGMDPVIYTDLNRFLISGTISTEAGGHILTEGGNTIVTEL